MTSEAADVSAILTDIQLGPPEVKRAALAKLRSFPSASVEAIQTVVDKAMQQGADGSSLRFFAAANLASRGDNRPIVADVLMPYMTRPCLTNEEGEPIDFPWLADCARSHILTSHLDDTINLASTMPGLTEKMERDPYAGGNLSFIWQHSAQLATLESVSHLRQDERVTDTLIAALETLNAPLWRALFLYALATLGHPKTRKNLEYYRDRFPKSVDGTAARVGLEHFGGKSFLEFIQLPEVSASRGGCFVATAVYGSTSASELDLLYTFRDQYLMPRPSGRALVRLYYAISPGLALFTSRSAITRRFMKAVIFRPLIQLLKKRLGSLDHA